MKTERRPLSRRELIVMMYAGAAGALLIMIAAAKAGGYWCFLSIPAWLAAAYLTMRGSELLHERNQEPGR